MESDSKEKTKSGDDYIYTFVVKFGLWNINSCSPDGRKIKEIVNEIENRQMSLVVLTETFQESKQIDFNSRFKVYNSGYALESETKFKGGVAFVVENARIRVDSFNPFSEKLASIEFKYDDFPICVIGCRAPEERSPQLEIDQFYSDLEYMVRNIDSDRYTTVLVMGDFKCQIGRDLVGDYDAVGPYLDADYSSGNGRRIIEFCEKNELFLTNSYFRKKERGHFTYYDESGQGYTTDLILAKRAIDLCVTDVRASPSSVTTTEHKLMSVVFRHVNRAEMKKGRSEAKAKEEAPTPLPKPQSIPLENRGRGRGRGPRRGSGPHSRGQRRTRPYFFKNRNG